MKKILFVFALGVALTSCKKDYTCSCTDVTHWPDGSTDTETFTYTRKSSKKDAKTWCEAYESTSNSGGISSSTTCEVK